MKRIKMHFLNSHLNKTKKKNIDVVRCSQCSGLLTSTRERKAFALLKHVLVTTGDVKYIFHIYRLKQTL